MTTHESPRWKRRALICGYALSLLVLLGTMVMLAWSMLRPGDVPFWRIGLPLVVVGALGGTFFGKQLRRELARGNP